MHMISNRPYLLRAFYDWIVDSNCTPVLVIDATNEHCRIPDDYVDGGEIVLNVAPVAVRDFKITNTEIKFSASFSGISHFISAPIGAVLAVYADENGEGLFLDAEEAPAGAGSAKLERMTLRGIDGSNAEPLEGYQLDDAPVPPVSNHKKPVLKLVE